MRHKQADLLGTHCGILTLDPCIERSGKIHLNDTKPNTCKYSLLPQDGDEGQVFIEDNLAISETFSYCTESCKRCKIAEQLKTQRCQKYLQLISLWRVGLYLLRPTPARDLQIPIGWRSLQPKCYQLICIELCCFQLSFTALQL